jgi:hypothetical protein
VLFSTFPPLESLLEVRVNKETATAASSSSLAGVIGRDEEDDRRNPIQSALGNNIR